MKYKLYPLAFVLMASGSAYAGPEYYAALSAGKQSQETENKSYDDDDVSAGIAFGVTLSQNAAVEISYKDFGESESTEGTRKLTAGVTAVNVGLKVFVPTNAGFDFVGHFGASRGDLEFTLQNSGVSTVSTVDDTGWYVGLGAEYAFSDHFYGEIGYTVTMYDIDSSTGGFSHDIKEITAALGFKF